MIKLFIKQILAENAHQNNSIISHINDLCAEDYAHVNLFFTMHDIEKIGIHPKDSEWQITGVYAFPWAQTHKEQLLNDSLDIGSDRKFITFLVPSASAKIITINDRGDIADVQIRERCIKALTQLNPKILQLLMSEPAFWKYKSYQKFFDLRQPIKWQTWFTVLEDAALILLNKSTHSVGAKVNQILRLAGFDAIFDRDGTINEIAQQIVFLTPTSFKKVQMFDKNQFIKSIKKQAINESSMLERYQQWNVSRLAWQELDDNAVEIVNLFKQIFLSLTKAIVKEARSEGLNKNSIDDIWRAHCTRLHEKNLIKQLEVYITDANDKKIAIAIAREVYIDLFEAKSKFLELCYRIVGEAPDDVQITFENFDINKKFIKNQDNLVLMHSLQSDNNNCVFTIQDDSSIKYCAKKIYSYLAYHGLVHLYGELHSRNQKSKLTTLVDRESIKD